MRACVKMVIMFLLLVLLGSTRTESACLVAPSDCNWKYLTADADSSCQLISMQEGINFKSDTGLAGSFYRGEMELVEKTVSQSAGTNSLRVRKSSDVSFFFKNIMQQLSSRVELLALDRNRIIYYDYSHGVMSPCRYYIFTLRHIVI